VIWDCVTRGEGLRARSLRNICRHSATLDVADGHELTATNDRVGGRDAHSSDVKSDDGTYSLCATSGITRRVIPFQGQEQSQRLKARGLAPLVIPFSDATQS
jgi:hypothetical protein